MSAPPARRVAIGALLAPVVAACLTGCGGANASGRRANAASATAASYRAVAGTRPGATRGTLIGRSTRGRPILLIERTSGRPGPVVLVVGVIHGTEGEGRKVVRRLLAGPPPARGQLWLIPDLNPDGLAANARTNARGVNLNRNFPSQWRPVGHPGDLEYAGPRPLSERETRLAVVWIKQVRPTISIWFHQPEDWVRGWGPSVPIARRYARLAGARFARIPWPTGSASNWQNHHFAGAASFVVELPPGTLPAPLAARYARAVRDLL